MVTDPPYGVGYEHVATRRSTKDGAGKSATTTPVMVTRMRSSQVQDRLRECTSLASGAARGLDACGFVRARIWDKGHIVIGRGHYHWRHETCWYAVKKGAQAHWAGDKSLDPLGDRQPQEI